MLLIFASLVASTFFPPVTRASDDPAPAVRRIAATAQLAAQEYRLGVRDGRVVLAPEVEEAGLFLNEARRTAGQLPPEARGATIAALDTLLGLVGAIAPPDTVEARVHRLISSLATGLGVALDVVPARVPPVSRGAELYRARCAGCHGLSGRGDGPAGAGLDPPPSDLTDAAALRTASPLDFYHRITIGVAGTAMPSFETALSAQDRWTLAVYASVLRLPPPKGQVPASLQAFSTTARMSDSALLAAISAGADPATPSGLARVAAARIYGTRPSTHFADQVLAVVRSQLDSAFRFAQGGRNEAASATVFDAYMTFEQVEPELRARNARLAAELEAAFAALRTRAAAGARAPELNQLGARLASDLERAQRALSDRLSGVNLFAQSLVILVREGLEAILIIGALLTFLMKTGAAHRKRDINAGIGAAVVASLLTAVAVETIFHITPARREALEGTTMLVATAVLFYVSYWLLSKMEVARWNRFVQAQMQDALSSGSRFALASVAFLAVYREGFETVLFYKALYLSGGSQALIPLLGGVAVGCGVLITIFLAVNRFGVRIPLKPFFGFTGAFLYYMAFVFAGQGIAELQEGGVVGTTVAVWAPRLPALGVYPTLESLGAQGVLIALLGFAMAWTFWIEPRRRIGMRAGGPSSDDSADRDAEGGRKRERAA